MRPDLNTSSPALCVYIAYLEEDQYLDLKSLFIGLPITRYLTDLTYVPSGEMCLYKYIHLGTATNSIAFRIGYSVVKVFKSCVHLCGVRDDKVAKLLVSTVIQLCKYVQSFFEVLYNNTSLLSNLPDNPIIDNNNNVYNSKTLITDMIAYLLNTRQEINICKYTIEAPEPQIVNAKHKYQIITSCNYIVTVNLARLAMILYDVPDIVIAYNNSINPHIMKIYYISPDTVDDSRKRKKQGSKTHAIGTISNIKKQSLVNISGLNKCYIDRMHSIVWNAVCQYLEQVSNGQT
jgi:hypothetical protein